MQKNISKFSLLSLCGYLCWWSISPRGYHPPSSQRFGPDMVYDVILAIPFMSFGLLDPVNVSIIWLSNLTIWRLFQKWTMLTKLNIYIKPETKNEIILHIFMYSTDLTVIKPWSTLTGDPTNGNTTRIQSYY